MVFSRLESYNYRPLPGIPGSSAFARFGAKAYKGIPRTWSLFQCQITMATLFPKSHPPVTRASQPQWNADTQTRFVTKEADPMSAKINGKLVLKECGFC